MKSFNLCKTCRRKKKLFSTLELYIKDKSFFFIKNICLNLFCSRARLLGKLFPAYKLNSIKKKLLLPKYMMAGGWGVVRNYIYTKRSVRNKLSFFFTQHITLSYFIFSLVAITYFDKNDGLIIICAHIIFYIYTFFRSILSFLQNRLLTRARSLAFGPT